MRFAWTFITFVAMLLPGLFGCRSQANHRDSHRAAQGFQPESVVAPAAFEEPAPLDDDASETAEQLPVPVETDSGTLSDAPLAQSRSSLSLDEVVASVLTHFPLIHEAAAARGVASGEALSAAGAFDHKLEGFSESQPLGFYENYRNAIGVKQDTIWGGQTFAGYRIGRGFFEPWYLERETNKGGEFKTGFVAPIIRDRAIDANRAELWRAQLERRRVEPEIMARVIQFVREGSVAYWNWVAAGENYRIANGLLELANTRNEGLIEQVEAQEKARIDLVDNRRIIVSREAKRIDARLKLEQAAVKLSLFVRSESGEPVLTDVVRLPPVFVRMLPREELSSEMGAESEDVDLALARRPELAELRFAREQLDVALRQARNETLPDVDGGLLASQDVGAPTSPKRDKSEFQLEALITVSVPLERRKAQGKVRTLRWKIAKLNAKNRFTADKIVAEVRIARATLAAARERYIKADESFRLAEQMQDAERELFNQGQGTLFNLNIREQQTAEAAAGRVQALFEYFAAKADLAAAMGFDGSSPSVSPDAQSQTSGSTNTNP